jgi:ribonuclease BN (tRNA processing enzyme)
MNFRSTSSILYESEAKNYMMLDAGPGTLSQLFKAFPENEASEVLSKLKLIFNTHTHGGAFLKV